MTVETVQIGRLTLHESYPGQVSTDSAGTFSLSGIEYDYTRTADANKRTAEDIRGLAGALVPVVFSSRPEAPLYARVVSVDVTTTRYDTQADVTTWKISFQRAGTDSEVDLASSLSGPQTRGTDHAIVGERWHAPPIGHYSYWSSSTLPSAVTRTGAEGPIVVYRGVPVNVNPRWGCTPVNYYAARVHFAGTPAPAYIMLYPALDAYPGTAVYPGPNLI